MNRTLMTAAVAAFALSLAPAALAQDNEFAPAGEAAPFASTLENDGQAVATEQETENAVTTETEYADDAATEEDDSEGVVDPKLEWDAGTEVDPEAEADEAFQSELEETAADEIAR